MIRLLKLCEHLEDFVVGDAEVSESAGEKGRNDQITQTVF